MEKNRTFIGSRLREERDRLGLSQDQFAELGGVSKRTQVSWERGDQTPNAEFLSVVAAAGVDVQYVITGRRSQIADATEPLRNEELLAARGVAMVRGAQGLEVELTLVGLMWLLNYERELPTGGRRTAFGEALLARVATFSPESMQGLNVQAVELHPYGNKRFHYLVIYLDRTPPTPFMVAPVAGLQTRIYLDEAFVNELPIRLQVSEIQPSPVLVLSQDEVRRLKDGAVLRCTA